MMLPQFGGRQPLRKAQSLTGVQSLLPKPNVTQPLAGLPSTGAPKPNLLGALKPTGAPNQVLSGLSNAFKPQAPATPGIAPTTVTPAQQNLGGAQVTPGAPANVMPMAPPPGLPTPGQIPNIGPTAPQEQSGPLTDFGPGNDLLSTQVNPYTGERLSGAQSGNDVLYKALTQGPNLQQAALDQFKNIQSKTAEQRQLGTQEIGRSAARLGRLGSGMVTTDLGNLEDTLRSHENQALGDLAYNTATQESADRRANLGAGQGYESQVYGQGQNARNEVRTERDYQAQQSQQALQNEIVRRQLQAQYQQYLASLGLQGAGLYGDQAAASQGAASSLLGF